MRIRSTALPVTVLLAVTALLVCGPLACSDEPPPREVVVRDSAGVRIVENGPVDFERGVWSVTPDPLFRVGWDSDGLIWEDARFGILLPGGRVAIADAGPDQVVILDRDGREEMRFGGTGDGPGEFGDLWGMARSGADSILIQDQPHARVAVYRDSVHHRDVPIGPTYDILRAVASDGGYLLFPFGYPLDFEVPWYEGTFVRANPGDGALDTIARYDWVSNRQEHGERNVFRPFGLVTVAGGHPVVTRTDRAEVRWLDTDGSVERIARWEQPVEPVTDAILDRYVETVRESWAPDRPGLEQAVADIREDTSGETLPLFTTPVGDAEGNVWLGDVAPARERPTRYHVVSSEGEWLGHVDVPAGLEILEIGTDRILAIETDPLDVQAVAVYGLDRGGRP